MKRSIFDHLFYRWLLILPLLGSLVCLGFSSVVELDHSLPISETSLASGTSIVYQKMQHAARPHQYPIVEVGENNSQEDNTENDFEPNSFNSAFLASTAMTLGNSCNALTIKRKSSSHIPSVFPKKYILFLSLKLDY